MKQFRLFTLAAILIVAAMVLPPAPAKIRPAIKLQQPPRAVAEPTTRRRAATVAEPTAAPEATVAEAEPTEAPMDDAAMAGDVVWVGELRRVRRDRAEGGRRR